MSDKMGSYELFTTSPNRRFSVKADATKQQLLDVHRRWLQSADSNRLGGIVKDGVIFGTLKPTEAGGLTVVEALRQLESLQWELRRHYSGVRIHYNAGKDPANTVITIGLEEGYGSGKKRTFHEAQRLVTAWESLSGQAATTELCHLSYQDTDQKTGATQFFAEPCVRITFGPEATLEDAKSLASTIAEEFLQQRFYLEYGTDLRIYQRKLP